MTMARSSVFKGVLVNVNDIREGVRKKVLVKGVRTCVREHKYTGNYILYIYIHKTYKNYKI